MLVGGDSNDENPLKRVEECYCSFDRGEEEYLGRRGRTGGVGNFNDDNSLKRAEKCP